MGANAQGGFPTGTIENLYVRAGSDTDPKRRPGGLRYRAQPRFSSALVARRAMGTRSKTCTCGGLASDPKRRPGGLRYTALLGVLLRIKKAVITAAGRG